MLIVAVIIMFSVASVGAAQGPTRVRRPREFCSRQQSLITRLLFMKGGTPRSGSADHWECGAQLLSEVAAASRSGCGLSQAWRLVAPRSEDPFWHQVCAAFNEFQDGRELGSHAWRGILSSLDAHVRSPAGDMVLTALVLSEQTGTSMADLLATTSERMRRHAKVVSARQQVLSAPRATWRVLSALPWCVLLVGSAVLWDDPFKQVADPVVCGSVVLGAAFQGVGYLWYRALVRKTAAAEDL